MVVKSWLSQIFDSPLRPLWRIFPLFFSAVFTITALAQTPGLESYLERELTTRQIIEFSSLGSMKYLESRGIFEVRPDDYSTFFLNSVPITEVNTLNIPSPFRAYISPSARAWKLPHEDFSLPLRKMTEYFDEKGTKSIALSDIIESADRILKTKQQRGEIGKIYYGFRIRDGRNDRFIIELPKNVQTEIESVFAANDHSFPLSLHEKGRIRSGEFTLEEIVELKKLKMATEIFSKNSEFRDLPGGWANNSPNLNAYEGTVAYCGEQACTMSEFTKNLKEQGLLKKFDPVGNVVKKSLTDNHAASVLKNSRTNGLFVLDSWLVRGGEGAKILPFTSWALWLYRFRELVAQDCRRLFLKAR